MRTRGRFHGEQGASLVFALAFLALLGVFAASILSFGYVSFKNSEVTRARAQQLYAADGGIEYGIRKLQTETTLCPGVSGAPTTVGTQTINGKTVTVTCETTAGGATTVSGSPLLDGHVAVVGAGGAEVVGGGWGAADFHGDVFSGGPMSISWQESGTYGGFPITCAGWWAAVGFPHPNVCAWMDVAGSLDVSQATCPPQYVYPIGACTGNASAPNVTTPTVVIPTTTAPAASTSGIDLRPFGIDCTILYPGRYTSATFAADRKYYLASGTYYFSGTTDVTLQGQIFGGRPSPDEPWSDTQQVTGASSCAVYGTYRDDALAELIAQNAAAIGLPPFTYDDSKSGTGVTLVRGNTGKLRVSSAATKVELYTRVPATGTGAYDAAATPGVTFWANTSATGATGGTYTPVPNTCGTPGCDVFVTTEKQVDVVFHGLSYLPGSRANLTEPYNLEVGTSPGSVSFFLGGVMAKKLSVTRFFGDGEFRAIPLAGTGQSTVVTTPRTTRVTASAASSDGGAATDVVAVVYLPVDTTPPTVQSWRRI